MEWVEALGLFVEVAKQVDCPTCLAHPPHQEGDVMMTMRSYRVVGIKVT